MTPAAARRECVAPCRQVGVLLLAAGLAIAPGASAHRLLYPKRDSVVVTADALRATLQVSFDSDETLVVRDRFDRDADGTLSDAEAEAATRFLARRARRDFRIEIDARPLQLATTATSSGGLSRRAGAAPHLTVTVLLEAPLPDARRLEITVSDRSGSPLDGAVPLDVRLEGWSFAVPPEGARVEAGAEVGVQGVRGVRLAADRPWTMTLER